MFNPSINAGIAAAVRKKYIRAFREKNAIDPDHAVDPELIGVKRGMIFKSLIKQRILNQVTRELFYLDSERERIVHKKFKRNALAAIAFIVILFITILVIVLIINVKK